MVSANGKTDSERPTELRFAIMCGGTTFQAWQARCIRKLMEMGNVKPVLLIVDGRRSSAVSKLRKLNPDQMLGLAFRRLLSRPPVLKPVDLSAELADVPRLVCSPTTKGRFSEYFSKEDLEKIKEYDLDFVLRFGFNIIRGDILSAARYGVWSYHHDDETKYRGAPACFWEIYNDDPVTGSMLQRLTNRLDGGVVLKKGYFKTALYSYGANLNRVYHDSAEWPAQVCKDILNGNADYLNAPPSQTSAPIYRLPTTLQTLKFMFKLGRNMLTEASKVAFRHEEWNVGLMREPITSVMQNGAKSSIQWLPMPKRGRFLADPFGIAQNGKTYILCEDFDYKTHKAGIASIEVGNSVSSVKQQAAISEPYHMSYPYIVQHDGEIYCIPETGGAREVILYKAEDFPSRWTRVATLVSDFAGLDATVFEHDGLWWMMCSNNEDGRWDKLFIWHAESLFGPWKPHALNPVKTDIRSARPAGTPFIHEGQLYRPAQDCSKTYGGRITINRVTRLTPTEFAEEPVKLIEPDGNSAYHDGLHTLAAVGDVTLVDGKRYVFIPSGFLYSLRFLLKKLMRKAG